MNKKIIFNLVLTVIIIGLIFIIAAFLNPREKTGNILEENLTANVNIELEGNVDENQKQGEKVFALMKTNFGDIKLELFLNDAPNTVQNFIDLSESGFYNQVKFHRVIKDFMIQTGDPNSKDDNWSDDGMGGPGYAFDDEINSRKLVKGSLAMANSGPNTNGSQFFIVTADSTPWLDGKHTVFGKVAEGMEIVLRIENVETDKTAGDHPITDVIISGIEIIK